MPHRDTLPARTVAVGFTSSRQSALAAIYSMGAKCCAYSWGAEWADFCDCKYGVDENEKWPTAGERGNGCPELRSLHGVIQTMTDNEWTDLVLRAGGVPFSRPTEGSDAS